MSRPKCITWPVECVRVCARACVCARARALAYARALEHKRKSLFARPTTLLARKIIIILKNDIAREGERPWASGTVGPFSSSLTLPSISLCHASKFCFADFALQFRCAMRPGAGGDGRGPLARGMQGPVTGDVTGLVAAVTAVTDGRHGRD